MRKDTQQSQAPRFALRTLLLKLVLLLILAYAVAALTHQVLWQGGFSAGFAAVQRLGQGTGIVWGMAVLLFVWALAVLRLRPAQEPFGPSRWLPKTGHLAGLAALLLILALAPFWTSAAAHLILPVWVALVLAIALLSIVVWVPAWPKLQNALRTVLDRPWWPFAAAALASLWFFVVSYYRHQQFGSGSRDMGLFFQTVWLLSTGQAPLNTLIDISSPAHAVSAFADHLEFIDLLMVPLVWIWKDAGALLLAQAIALGSGVAALWRITRRHSDDSLAALFLSLAYFVSLPISQAVQFDWNPTTMGVGFLLWAFDFAERRRYVGMAIFLLLLGLCKENLLLYVAAFGLYLALEGHSLRLAASISASALLLFGVELKLIFPAFRAQGFRHFYFHQLGQNLGEVGLNILRSPLRALALLWTPEQKINGLLLPFSATAWLSLLAPAALVVALPCVGERFLSDFRNTWWGYHYGGPAAAVALVAAAQAIGQWAPLVQSKFAQVFRDTRASSALAALILGSSMATSFLGPWGASDLFVLEKPYLPPKIERQAMRAAIAQVPEGAPVAAQNYLVAHLAARPQIYELSQIERAQIVVVDLASNPWPFSAAQLRDKVRRVAQDSQWHLSFCQSQALVFDRRETATQTRVPLADCPAVQSLLRSP